MMPIHYKATSRIRLLCAAIFLSMTADIVNQIDETDLTAPNDFTMVEDVPNASHFLLVKLERKRVLTTPTSIPTSITNFTQGSNN